MTLLKASKKVSTPCYFCPQNGPTLSGHFDQMGASLTFFPSFVESLVIRLTIRECSFPRSEVEAERIGGGDRTKDGEIKS